LSDAQQVLVRVRKAKPVAFRTGGTPRNPDTATEETVSIKTTGMQTAVEPVTGRFNGTPVRIIADGPNLRYCAYDIARALEYTDTWDAVQRHCKGSMRAYPMHTGHGTRQIEFLNEGDVCRLIDSSRTPQAERFEHWLFDGMAPSVQHETAEASRTPMSNEQMALASIRWLEEVVRDQETKVMFADAVSESEGSISVGNLAKLLAQNGVDTGSVRLFAWMRDNGWLMKNGIDYNMPTQKAVRMGLFEIKETVIHHSGGPDTIGRTPRVTCKGQRYFMDRLMQDQRCGRQPVG
jgi:anti-repressor protein